MPTGSIGTFSGNVSIPTNDPNNNPYLFEITGTVTADTPVLTWANPASITYGTTLSATQLDATASYNGSNVSGTFVYTPAAGTVLHAGANQSLGVVFTPTDTTDYTNANASAQITVTQATPTITWANPANITYGTALSATQLDATAAFGGSGVAGAFVYTPASGTVLHAGANQSLGVTFTPTDTTDYTNANGSAHITVIQATPVIAWANPANIIYGTALSATQLDATAAFGGSNVAGNFVYTPASGTVLHAGANQNLGVAFTPTDTTDYTNANASAQITVTQATPVITWSNPANITYGTALSATQLDATAAFAGTGLAGTFVYTPASGTVLHAGANQSLGVAFTPTDTTDYTNANASTQITVTQATPVITWANPANITYGTALSATQLDATAAFAGTGLAGTLVYTPASGTVLHAGANQSLGVAFTPTDTTDYTNANASTQITVTQATPVITWANPSNITYGTALSATQLDATAAFSGTGLAGTFVYTPAATTASSTPVRIRAWAVAFTPTDTTDYTTANASAQITVTQATPVITWSNPAIHHLHGTALHATRCHRRLRRVGRCRSLRLHACVRNGPARRRQPKPGRGFHPDRHHRLHQCQRLSADHGRPSHARDYLGQPRQHYLWHSDKRPPNSTPRQPSAGRASQVTLSTPRHPAPCFRTPEARTRTPGCGLHPNRHHRLHQRQRLRTDHRHSGDAGDHLGQSHQHHLRHRPQRHATRCHRRLRRFQRRR